MDLMRQHRDTNKRKKTEDIKDEMTPVLIKTMPE